MLVTSQSLVDNLKRPFWLLQTAGWVCFLGLHFLGLFASDPQTKYAFLSLTATALGFTATSLLRLGYRRIEHLPLRSLAPLAALMLLASAMIGARIYLEAVIAVCPWCQRGSYVWQCASILYVQLSWTGLYFGIKLSRQLQHQKEAALRAEAMAHAAQLKMLRYQINPHFLFNTLNAISTLVLEGRGQTANHMVSGLSSFLRYSLDSDPEQRVSLTREIDSVNLYLGIEQLRFGDRLRVQIDVETQAHHALVPSMILQPLIENIVKHVVAKQEEGARIQIAARCDRDSLDIHICDNGPGFAIAGPTKKGSAGVGLANTRERLHVLYGDRSQFAIGPALPHGTDVHLRLPFETAATSN